MNTDPSRTAYRVALRRAAHQVFDDAPLVFRDPFAIPILGPAAAEELRRTPGGDRRPFSAALRAWVVARSRFAEDVLARAEQAHSRLQYLVLGAGLDTFAFRNPFAGVQVFEVDHPATQLWKQGKMKEAGVALQGGARQIAVDFETEQLLEKLVDGGFDPDVPTVVAWLGVVPYLSRQGFSATCTVLGGLARGSAMIFDYAQPRDVLPAVEQQMRDSLAARVAGVGEPFQLFFTPDGLGTMLSQFGLRVTHDLGADDLNRMYFAGRRDGLGVHGSGGRLCLAVPVGGTASGQVQE